MSSGLKTVYASGSIRCETVRSNEEDFPHLRRDAGSAGPDGLSGATSPE
jgi:hypothetical protein